MSNNLIEKGYGTLFPVMTGIVPDPAILSFLDNGGKALLFGEHGDEYASGRMRKGRIAEETADAWVTNLSSLRARAGLLVAACDADIAAVNRLHHVAGELPSRAEAIALAPEDLAAAIEAYARRVRDLGVNLVLSPTADCVEPGNLWLDGRTLGEEPETVSRLVSTFVTAARRGGLQAALKHFPGHRGISGNPAREHAVVPQELQDLLQQAAPFRAGIEAGADAVVMGSAVFQADSSRTSASLSPDLIALLRNDFGFGGLVITLDLDHFSAQGGRPIEDVSVAALAAGADLLLLSPALVPHIPSIVRAIAGAVEAGQLTLERLDAASAATLRAAR